MTLATGIPVGSPADWGGPFVAAKRNINALTQSELDNQIKKAQAQYAPYNAYGDAALKSAQAQSALPMAIAQMMSGPGAANMTPETQNALAQLAQNSLKNVGGINVPQPNQMNAQGGTPLQRLRSLFIGGNQQVQPQQNQNPVANMPMPNGQPQGNGNPVANIPNAMPQQNQGAPLGQGTQGGPFAQKNIQNRVPNTLGSDNANVSYEAGKAGQIAGSSTEATNLANQWNTQFNKSKNEAEGAQNNLNILDKLSNDYGELQKYERGPALGNIPAFTAAGKDFDANQLALADSVARAQQSGHITGADRATYGGMKPSRDMPPETFRRQKEFIKGMNERIGERPLFDLTMKNKHFSPEQAQIVWQYYIKARPFYDAKKDSYLGNNIGTWEDFLAPKKLTEAFSPKAQRIALKALQDSQNVKIPEFKLPEFSNQKEFQDWYARQPDNTQKLTRAALGEQQ